MYNSTNAVPLPQTSVPFAQVLDQLEQRVMANEALIAKLTEQLKPLYLDSPQESCPGQMIDKPFPPLAPLLQRALNLSDRLADSTRLLSNVSDRLQV
jgi:hypothetical protein